MAGLDRERLATYVRNKMALEKLSLRRAADQAGCSPATFSRLLAGENSEHTPDTDTIDAVIQWVGKPRSEFESTTEPGSKTLADVAVHLHALPDLAPEDAKFIMSVVQLLYDDKRKKPTED